MISRLDRTIDSILRRAVAEVASAVQASLAAEIAAAIRGTSAQPKRRGPTKATPARASKREPGFIRRSPEQVAKDDAAVLAYVKAHPGQRSEEIQAGTGFRKKEVASALLRLRDGRKVKMKGQKRAARYSAA